MADYTYYRKITIDNTKVAETDANFAVLLNLTAAGSGVLSDLATVGNGGDVENTANGGASGAYTVPADLTFRTTADLTEAGASLDFEIEHYDAATGALVAWVQSGVNSGADVDIYMIYGNSGVTTSQEDVSGTWDANFKGVWHLNDDFFDSTVNSNDGTNQGSADCAGKIADGQDFIHTENDYISIAAFPRPTAGLTIETWVNNVDDTATLDYQQLNGADDSGSGNSQRTWQFGLADNTGIARFLIFTAVTNYQVYGDIDVFSEAGWTWLVGTYDGNTLIIYENSALKDSDNSMSGNLIAGTGMAIGRQSDEDPHGHFNGNIDEVRISDIARSADWLSTVYANQNAPDTFYSVGSKQPTFSQSLTGALTFIGSVSSDKITAQSTVGTLSFAGALVKKAIKTLTGTLTPSGVVLLDQDVKFLTGVLTLSGIVSSEAARVRTLTGALTTSGHLITKRVQWAGADYEYMIDTVSEDMDNLEVLIGAVPAGVHFRYHSTIRTSGEGLGVGDGYAQCEWPFDFLSWTDLGTMLDFLNGNESASLYINTRRPDNTYSVYSAIMHRPRVPGEATQIIGGWRNVTFRFTHLEVV